MDTFDYILISFTIVVFVILLFQIIKLVKNINRNIQKKFKNRFKNSDLHNFDKVKLKNRGSVRLFNSLYISDEHELNELRKNSKELP